MAPESEPDRPFKYFPFNLGESEDLENYEPGGFHPVHIGDTYDDDRYKIVHKLGFGGFSTVWLARDSLLNRWVALKIIMAAESPTYLMRSAAIVDCPDMNNCPFFARTDRQFWLDGPNGHHLCLVLPVLGPNLSSFSRGIYCRIHPDFVKNVSSQAVQALAFIHSLGICHGDFTVSNIALRLTGELDRYDEEGLHQLFGKPQISPLHTYSGAPPQPHGPGYIVAPLNFCDSTVDVLDHRICIIDFDQSFTVKSPQKRLGIPAKYLAPEVAVGQPAGPASDIWAFGCAVFQMRSGYDIFFDYDTDCPADALRQVVKVIGSLPTEWGQTRFGEDGYSTTDGTGELFWSLDETRSLQEHLNAIWDEPDSLFIDSHGGSLEAGDLEPEEPQFPDDAELRLPIPNVLKSIAWRPTAVCVEGRYIVSYSDDTDLALKAFPKMPESEISSLLDLLSKVFVYDPVSRISAKELAAHPWFLMIK